MTDPLLAVYFSFQYSLPVSGSKLLSELGVPAYAVLRYEDALARGAAVVAVHTDNGFEVETVSQILRDGGCEQVAAA